MKKKVLLAVAVVMTIGSIRAMASATTAEQDSISVEITDGKLDAAELDMNRVDIKDMMKEMERMQEDLSNVANSGGLMSALSQTISVSENILKESGDDIKKMRQLKIEVRQRLNDFKAAADKM